MSDKRTHSKERHPAVAAAYAIADEDEAFATELMNCFIADTQAHVQTLHEALPMGDATGMRRAAHSLKGLAASVSAESMYVLAKRLEGACLAGNLEEVTQTLPSLEQAWQEIIRAMREEIATNP